MQILFEKNGMAYDMGTSEGRKEILGEIKCKQMFVYDEQGELVNFYDNPADMAKNAALIKSIKEQFPNVSLRKALDLFEGELLLKARKEKNEMLLKARPAKPAVKTGRKRLDAALTKLDEILMAQSAR